MIETVIETANDAAIETYNKAPTEKLDTLCQVSIVKHKAYRPFRLAVSRRRTSIVQRCISSSDHCELTSVTTCSPNTQKSQQDIKTFHRFVKT
jgi:glucuronate isomerase